MTSRKLVVAAVVAALCGGIGWKWMGARHGGAPSPTAALDTLEARSSWSDPKAQANLAIRLVTEAKRTQDPALWDRAALAAQRALAHDPERVDALKVQLLVMMNQHRFREVEAETLKLAQAHPADGMLHGMLGDAQLEQGKYDDAAAAYQLMVDEKPNAATYGRIAYLRLLQGDLDGAIEMGELAARTAAQSDGDAVAWALSDLADVYFAKARPDTALKYFDTALAHEPKFSRAIEGRGHALRALGRLPEAIAAYRAAVSLAPTAQHRASLGLALQQAGQADAAREEFTRALAASQGDNRTQAALLLDSGGDAARALTLATEEFQRRRDVITEDLLAYALLRNGKTAEAAQASTHARRLGTRDARLASHAAQIEEAQGRTAEARRDYADALTLSPPLPAEQAAHAQQFLTQHPSGVVTANVNP